MKKSCTTNTLVAAGCLAVGLVAGVFASSYLPGHVGTKAQVQAVVKEYIADNGAEIIASAQAAANKAQQVDTATYQKIANEGNAPSMGPKEAPVTIVEFSDYQCPFCGRVQDALGQVRAKYGDNVRWVFKNLPLPFHPEAKPAAYAALAAQNQGKFWEYNKQLWEHQDTLGDALYVQIAKDLGLNLDQFNKDRASDDVKKHVESDLKEADAMGARGTPHFVINGEQISGALPAEAFEQVIDTHLKDAKK